MGKSHSNFFELTIKYSSETPDDYTQYFIKNKRIKNIKQLIVEYNNDDQIVENIIWTEEYDIGSNGESYKSTIPYVIRDINENKFLCRLSNFKRVGVIKSK
jgi:hypothetical protein